ncbi:hypothetical protein BLL42_28515 (plasmid) [Pseudomonas frederiksbergensis]|uniref:Uncharacterized protein n=2 Tax=Pseudomonas frederiksbergensis TaxID=104087 RepID=A0A1J0EU28_9PSED|nr:hypothetical protein BLL42_26870 [Pseudomonas frederiksbergensis]APC19650.1 hypothetical protein BLL42_28515 [Pseudomonas frederiksbergensis]
MVAGFDACTVRGTYFDCDPSYVPDFTEWDEEAVEGHDSANGYSHCWVSCEGLFIDICAAQFHPHERDKYRVVVVNQDSLDYQVDQ